MKSHGRFWKLDSEGYLLNDASSDQISSEFNPVIKAVRKTYLAHLGSSLHSCYLTGSISRGTAMSKVSDLDAFAVLKKDCHPDISWVSHAKTILQREFPIVADIQMEVWKWEDLVPNDFLSEYQVILKLNSVCLWGENLASHIQPIRPDNALALTELRELKSDIEEVLTEIEKHPNQVAFWCKKIMKNLIRAGFYLIIPREKAFTRDLPLGAATFLKYYPEMVEINKCLEYAKSPLTEAKDLNEFLQSSFVNKLLYETLQLLNTNEHTI